MTGYKTSEGDGSLAIIGNHLHPGSDIYEVHSQDAYVAGNVLETGVIIAKAPVWIVGNSINSTLNQDPVNINTVGGVQVLANRVTLNSDSRPNVDSKFGIYINASSALIAGNIVKVQHANTSSYTYTRHGIHATGATFARVINNVVDFDADRDLTTSTDGIEAYGLIAGNIVIDVRNQGFGIRGGGVIEHNLCFNNDDNCGTANGNLAVGPQFVDTTDYQLAAGSPAIDAGPSDLSFADLDRSRNDMGAYGGPWSIGQYDAQRDPNNFAPYVFPLFKADDSFSDGSLQVRALGVARLR